MKVLLLFFRLFVQCGAIPPMCELLGSTDARILQVALTGLENILRVGQNVLDEQGLNPNALIIEHCYGTMPDLIHLFAINVV